MGERLGLAVWGEDEAGPFQTIPCPGQSWRPAGHPAQQPHEYIRNGTAKLLTLFHPASGQVHVKGVTRCSNDVLHAWLKEELTAILATITPSPLLADPEVNRAFWQVWRADLTAPLALPEDLPPLRLLLIWDNLKGHKSTAIVPWLIQQGVMPLYTPLGGSWLNMTESIQRILKRRALEGQNLTTPTEIITQFEAVARAWNRHPTPFVWGGKRAVRRARSRQRRHTLGGSGACTRRPVRQRASLVEKWRCSKQMTH